MTRVRQEVSISDDGIHTIDKQQIEKQLSRLDSYIHKVTRRHQYLKRKLDNHNNQSNDCITEITRYMEGDSHAC